MNQTVVDRLLPLVEAYALGRRHQKELRTKMRGRPCERTGPLGLGCHFSQGPSIEEEPGWCQNCLAREPIWEMFCGRRRANRELLRRIEVLGLKLSLPDVPPEPEAPRELLALMNGEP